MAGLTINQEFENLFAKAEERFCSNCALYEPKECGAYIEIFNERCSSHKFAYEYTPPEWDF